jgi:hypothetical protein
VSTDHEAAHEMIDLTGRTITPTLAVGEEVLIGFAQNRARIEELFPKSD